MSLMCQYFLNNKNILYIRQLTLLGKYSTTLYWYSKNSRLTSTKYCNKNIFFIIFHFIYNNLSDYVCPQVTGNLFTNSFYKLPNGYSNFFGEWLLLGGGSFSQSITCIISLAVEFLKSFNRYNINSRKSVFFSLTKISELIWIPYTLTLITNKIKFAT